MADLTPENTKFVDFAKYCKLCKHEMNKDFEDPCNECITTPTNLGSVKPINFEEK